MPGDILIIKLGALGDLVQALGPMAAIRAHHREARITLLTTAPFEAFMAASGLVDDIWVDSRPSLINVAGWMGLRRRLRDGGFARVYDLQTSDRSAWYFRLFGRAGRPEWSGVAPGCSHPHANPDRDSMHTLERQREQLSMAGIASVPAPSLDWVPGELKDKDPGGPYAVVAPGGAAHRPDKRWPGENFADLAGRLAAAGLRPVFVGGPEDRVLTGGLAARVTGALDLGGRTSLLELAGLCRGAALAVGNDTGPMHMAAVAGAPSLVLYSHDSDPALCAQRGRRVEILRCPDLRTLDPEDAARAAAALRGGGP